MTANNYGIRMKKLVPILTTSLALCMSSTLFAQDNNSLNYNVLNFQTEASRTVSNDEMSIGLYIEKSNKQPTVLASEINQLMNKAIASSKKYPQVKIETGAQSTYPIYDDNNRKIKEWRGRAEIRLESQDFKAASQLMSELQQDFQTQSINFNISEAKRKKIENELVIEASKNFQDRAKSLAQAWNKSNYQLINLNINTNSYSQRTSAIPRVAMMKAASFDAVPEQELSSGESQINVNANGSIQFK